MWARARAEYDPVAADARAHSMAPSVRVVFADVYWHKYELVVRASAHVHART